MAAPARSDDGRRDVARGVMAPPGGAPAYRPLMGMPPRAEPQALCVACPDAELPSLRWALWAVAWVMATVLTLTHYSLSV